MAPSRIRITGARITPVAFADPPLLNTVGVHQPYALRAIIQLDTDAGLVGLGETYADQTHLSRLEAAADAITGLDVFALNAIRAAIAHRLRGDTKAIGTAGMITTASAVDQVLSPFEVACLDVQGHATGRPVSDLLGGTVRDAVPFSAYLFYKWAAHPGHEPDTYGVALDPDGLVTQAKRIIDEYGFTAIKLKGGVFAPEEEMAAIEAEMQRLKVDDVLLQTLVTLINLGARKAGLAAPPDEEEGAKRDLEQTRQAIDGARALLPLLEARHGEELGPVKDAVSRLQMAYVQLSGGTPPPAAKPSPSQPEQPDAGPAQSSGRLWVPGQ